jgi:hypothetical protein
MRLEYIASIYYNETVSKRNNPRPTGQPTGRKEIEMEEYYIRISTYGTNEPHIVDEESMYQAERGMNYLSPDEFMFLCEAECLHDAEEQYWKEFSETAFDEEGERTHP